MRFAFTTILRAPRFGWQPAPPRADRLALYAAVREMGFEGIEWSPRWLDPGPLSDRELAELRAEVEGAGLTVCGVNLNRCLPTRGAGGERAAGRIHDAVRAAGPLGAGAVTLSLSLPDPPTADRPPLRGADVPAGEFDRAAAVLRDAARRAGDAGARLVLELHDDGLLDSPDLLLRMVAAVDHPAVRVNPDFGNLIRQPAPPCGWREALDALAPHAGFWHVKNYRDRRPVPVWEGEIDYAEAFATMRRHGFGGWV